MNSGDLDLRWPGAIRISFVWVYGYCSGLLPPTSLDYWPIFSCN